MSERPLISVVIPAYNAAATLGETLESLLAQTEPNWRAIIVDDGSTDGTAAVIAAYTARDSRFSSIAGQQKGVAFARNAGLARATGKWLHFLDADDWIAPTAFEKLLQALAAAPHAVAAYCNWRRTMPDGTESGVYWAMDVTEDAFTCFAEICRMAIHAVLTDRAISTVIGGFDTDLKSCEDWDFWQRFARLGGAWVHVPEALVYYRATAGSLSRDLATMLANGREVAARAFAPDPRMAGLALKWPNGLPADETRNPAKCFAPTALWQAAQACVSGGNPRIDPSYLRPLAHPLGDAEAITYVLFDGVLTGLRLTPPQLAAHWPQFGPALTDFITWLGEIWENPALARAVQYRVESNILYVDEENASRRLHLTAAVAFDMADPPETPLPPGIDRLRAHVMVGNWRRASLDIAALGTFTRRDWLEQTIALGDHSYRRWQRRHGLVTHLHLLRQAASPAQWRRAAAAIRANPARLRHRRTYAAALAELKNLTMRAMAGPAAAPGSHAAALAALLEAPPLAPPPPPAPSAPTGAVPGSDRLTYWQAIFAQPDPFEYGSPYEREKYQRQLDLLPPGPIANALELACAEGHFTAALAARVDHLTATDISPTALTRAAQKCAGLANVAFRPLDLAADPIPPDMDLIVCSEVLYYLGDEAELHAVAARLAAALAPDGCLVTAHPFCLSDDPTRTGFDWPEPYGAAKINTVLAAQPLLALEQSIVTELYRIDRFRRRPAGQPIPRPDPPVIASLPIEAELAPRIASQVVWGGAKVRRQQAAHERRDQVPVLIYHRVAESGPAPLARYRVHPDMFRRQMRWLRANGYHAITSAQLVWLTERPEPFPGRPVLITFDDGFQDFADTAWPILQHHDLLAEMFLVTAKLGQSSDWDSQYGPPAPLMTAATITRLAAEGCAFGSHLATHRPADRFGARELAEELAHSRARITELTGQPCASLAVPYSIPDGRLAILARDCGYQAAFLDRRGPARRGDNKLDLPRLEVRGDVDFEAFTSLMESLL